MNHTEDEKSHCAGLAGRLFGHRFEPRYDSEESFPEDVGHYDLMHVQDMTTFAGHAVERINAMKVGTRKYVMEVCARCGKTIKRNNKVELGF